MRHPLTAAPVLLQLDEQVLLTCLKHICWENREASGQALHAFMRMLQHDKLHLEDIMNMQVCCVCVWGPVGLALFCCHHQGCHLCVAGFGCWPALHGVLWLSSCGLMAPSHRSPARGSVSLLIMGVMGLAGWPELPGVV